MKKLYLSIVAAFAAMLVGAQAAFAQAGAGSDPVAQAQTALGDNAESLAGLVAYGIAGVAIVALAWAAMRIVPKVIKKFT